MHKPIPQVGVALHVSKKHLTFLNSQAPSFRVQHKHGAWQVSDERKGLICFIDGEYNDLPVSFTARVRKSTPNAVLCSVEASTSQPHTAESSYSRAWGRTHVRQRDLLKTQ